MPHTKITLGESPWGATVVNALSSRLSPVETKKISETYSDIRSFNVPAGLSMTLFIREGKTILAFRGTEGFADFVADGILALGIPPSLNPQYVAAKAQIDKWIADGVIQGDFSVTGHSLGGYLAAAIKEIYPSKVHEAYVFNAPGTGNGEIRNSPEMTPTKVV